MSESTPCRYCGLPGCAGCADSYGVADEPSRVPSDYAGWVVEFDYRDDDGERLVGPFPTKTEGRLWLSRQAFDYEALVRPIVAPDA